MALIQYVEPISIGEIFAGLGMLIFTFIICFIIYSVYKKFIQYIDTNMNRTMKYEVIEEIYLDKAAAKAGIDLQKELIKRDVLKQQRPKTIRQRVIDDIYSDMFGDERSSSKKGGKKE